MSAVKIGELPAISTVTLDDHVIIEQTIGATITTHRATVGELIGSFSPVPEITLLTWDSGAKELEVKADNILPNSLITVNDVPYLPDSYVYGVAPNASVVISIPAGLAAAEYTVKVKNFVQEHSDTFIVV